MTYHNIEFLKPISTESIPMNQLSFGFGIIQIRHETKKLLLKHCQVVYAGPTFWIRSYLFVFVLEYKSSLQYNLNHSTSISYEGDMPKILTTYPKSAL